MNGRKACVPKAWVKGFMLHIDPHAAEGLVGKKYPSALWLPPVVAWFSTQGAIPTFMGCLDGIMDRQVIFLKKYRF